MSNKGIIVAITGQSGCGKSTLSAFYRSRSYTVIDCDEVAKDVHNNPQCIEELAQFFGADIVFEGRLDKALLSQRAFSSAANLQKLTDITHPYIIRDILRQAQTAFEAGEQLVFVDGAVIINHDFEKYCDKFIVVVASREVQRERLIKRDGITLRQAQERIGRQTSYSDMLKKADYVIYNNKGPDSLVIQGAFVLKQLENAGKGEKTLKL